MKGVRAAMASPIRSTTSISSLIRTELLLLLLLALASCEVANASRRCAACNGVVQPATPYLSKPHCAGVSPRRAACNGVQVRLSYARSPLRGRSPPGINGPVGGHCTGGDAEGVTNVSTR